MIHRYNVKLSTMEEDFRKIGLLPEDELVEEEGYDGQRLMEMDDPRNPRDVPSPDPSTMAGNDDSQSSINSKARHSTGTQPRPKIAPDEKNDHDDALQAGGAQGGKSAGKYNPKPRMRGEDTEYEEGMEQGADPSHGYSQYKIVAKKPGMEPTDGKNADTGKAPDKAQGNEVTKEIGGMGESSALRRASDLIGEVEALVNGARADEDIVELVRGFSLLGENAAILADRLAEISDAFEVEHVIEAMEELSKCAVDALDIVEMKHSFYKDKKSAIDKKWMPEENEDDEEVVEGLKEAFQAMTMDLMDAIEAYDGVLEDIAEAYAGEEGADDDPLSEMGDVSAMSAREKMAYMRQMRGR